MAAPTAKAAAGNTLTATTNTIPFPGTPAAGDPIWIAISTNSLSLTLTAGSVSALQAAGWTVEYNTTTGTFGVISIHKNYAAGDGTGVSVTFTGTASGTVYAAVVFDGTLYSGFGPIGTITQRATSVTTSTAVATGSSAAPNFVVAHEKASTHTANPTAVTSKSVTMTDYVNLALSGASSGSIYMGSYDDTGGPTNVTLTYTTASSNGEAFQVPLVPASTTYAAAGTTAATATSTGSATTSQPSAGAAAGTTTSLGAATTSQQASGTSTAATSQTGAATMRGAAAGTSTAAVDTTAAATPQTHAAGTIDATTSSTGTAVLLAAAAGQADADSDTTGAARPPTVVRDLTLTWTAHQRTLAGTEHPRTLTGAEHRARVLTGIEP